MESTWPKKVIERALSRRRGCLGWFVVTDLGWTASDLPEPPIAAGSSPRVSLPKMGMGPLTVWTSSSSRDGSRREALEEVMHALWLLLVISPSSR